MKKLVSVILVLVFVFSCLPVAGAAEMVATEKIEFDDGSYLIVETIQNGARAARSISGSKPYTYYNASNVSTTIYNSSWSTVSKSASKSGNKATGSVTMKQSTVKSVPISLSLSCSASGSLS